MVFGIPKCDQINEQPSTPGVEVNVPKLSDVVMLRSDVQSVLLAA